jgi:hypothetical protein
MKNNMKKSKVKAMDIIGKKDKMCPESYDEMAVPAHRSLVTL